MLIFNKLNNNSDLFGQNVLQNTIQAKQSSNIIEKKDLSDIYEPDKTVNKKNNNKKKFLIIAGILFATVTAIMLAKRKDILNILAKNKDKLRTKNVQNVQSPTVNENIINETTKSISDIPSKVTKECIEMTSQKAFETLKNGADDSKLIKAAEYITEHGISNIEEINTTYFANGSDDVIISLVKLYEKWGSKNQADYLMIPIASKKYTSLTDRSELYKEILKAVQKLADLSDYTEQERKEIFYNPIRNLLNHNDKDVRTLAQETLNKIIPSEYRSTGRAATQIKEEIKNTKNKINYYKHMVINNPEQIYFGSQLEIYMKKLTQLYEELRKALSKQSGL